MQTTTTHNLPKVRINRIADDRWSIEVDDAEVATADTMSGAARAAYNAQFDALGDRRTVVEHLHWNGYWFQWLTEGERWTLFCMGDGFGTLAPAVVANINSGYDWSHIRDSSDDALGRIAAEIRRIRLARLQ